MRRTVITVPVEVQ